MTGRGGEKPDLSQGWCCDGRTFSEHVGEEGRCCQLPGTEIAELPPEGRQRANERLAKDAPELLIPGE